MKTVMKKMFSLLLVAVLLVSAVPFAASAHTVENSVVTVPVTVYLDGVNKDNYNKSIVLKDEDGLKEYALNAENGLGLLSNSEGRVFEKWVTSTGKVLTAENPGSINYDTLSNTSTEDASYSLELYIKTAEAEHTHSHTSAVTTAATCTTAGVKTFTCECDDSYTETIPAKGHTPGDEATCDTPQTCTVCEDVLAPATGVHNVVDGKCTTCGTDINTDQEPEAINWEIKYVEGGPVKDSGFFTPNGESAAAKDILYYHVFDKTTAWKDQYDLDNMKVWSSEQQKDVGYNGTINAGDTVTFVLTSKDDTSDDSSSTGNSGTSSNIPSGSHTLHVWANIYIGGTLEKTILMDTKATGVSGSAKIVDVMAALRSDLNAEVKSSKFDDYHGLDWDTQDYYYKVDDGEYKAISNRMTVSDDNHVYINLYSAEKLVVVNVHTSKSYSTDLSVRIRGKRVGDTVTYDDVKDAVKKYYNVSSLSIYEYDEWCDVVEGGSGKKTYDFKVEDGDNVYEAYISGSRKSGTYTYTADSSNPKTGDAIFAPMIVLGASASALAVLFYLNKKRAY